MAQWNIQTQDYLNQERSLFEVFNVATKDGEQVSVDNPFPVSLGSSSITIIGDITIPGIVTVTSSPESPVHNHITEVGTSDALNVPYLPVGVGTVNLNLSYLPIGISSLLNTVSISNTSFARLTALIFIRRPLSRFSLFAQGALQAPADLSYSARHTALYQDQGAPQGTTHRSQKLQPHAIIRRQIPAGRLNMSPCLREAERYGSHHK